MRCKANIQINPDIKNLKLFKETFCFVKMTSAFISNVVYMYHSAAKPHCKYIYMSILFDLL